MDIKKKLIDEGFVENDLLVPLKRNFFVAIASGLIENTIDQTPLGDYKKEFVLCHNLKERDDNWDNPLDLKASMAGPDENGPGHVFITIKNLDWRCFNVETMNATHVPLLERMYDAAKTYTASRGWTNAGYYFHRWPNNTVYSLHLHVINIDKMGHTFVLFPEKHEHIEDVLKKMRKLV